MGSLLTLHIMTISAKLVLFGLIVIALLVLFSCTHYAVRLKSVPLGLASLFSLLALTIGVVGIYEMFAYPVAASALAFFCYAFGMVMGLVATVVAFFMQRRKARLDATK